MSASRSSPAGSRAPTSDRKNQPAAMRRRIETLEALLAAEKDAHARTFGHYREVLWELVELKQRHRRAIENLTGDEA